MRQRMKSFPLSACALTTALLVSACGGGSSSPPASATSSSGFAVDGYLSAATVLCDANSNGSADTGEVTVSTDSSGFFKFTPACSTPLVVMGGTNVDTGLAFTGKLKAPTGSTVVSPLTTLLAEGMTSDQVAKSLGLPAGIDFSNTDPALAKDGAPVNADLLKKTLAVQQLAQKTMEVFARLASPIGTVASPASPAIYSEVLAGMAAEMRRGVVLVSGTTADESVVAALVKAALQRVGMSTILSTEIKAAASSVNADGLGKVMAGGLKAQIESILKSTSTSAGITAASKAAQSDTQIATFVDANKAMLASAPTAATTTLGATLASQVMASMGGGSPAPVTPGPVTPAPTLPGTLLVSFDEATPAATGIGAYGGAMPTVEPGPTGGAANALKILKPTSPDTFGGTYFNVAAIPFATDRKKITAKVFATRANAAIKFKVEVVNGPFVEVEAAVPGAVNTWQTVTWDLAGVDVTKAYTVVAITPDAALVTTGQAYYIDDITLAPAAAVVTPPPPPPAPTSTVLVSFDEATPPGLIEFGTNGAGALIATDPTGGTNKVAKVFKYIVSEQWAGTTVATVGVGTTNAIATIPFTVTNKTMTVRVYSPAVGVRVRLKVENAANGGITVETDAITTMANAWETLSFNFANPGTNPPVGGGATAALNLANVYNKASLFFDFGLGNGGSGPLPADRIYYFDDLSFVTGSSGTVTPPPPPPTPTSAVLVSFDEATPPGLIEFGTNGAGALIATDPTGGTNKVAKVFKYIVSEQWAGTTVATVGVGTANAIATIPFTATNKTMTVRVYSPAVGVRVRLKVENAANGGITVETDAITTMAGAWETLSFNFANPGTNPPVGGGATAALNLANVYNKASLFFDFGLGNGGSGPLPADRIYYFDDLSFVN